MGLGGLEPPTSSLSGKRSNRLSYRPSNNDHGADPSLTLEWRRDTRDYRNRGTVPNPRGRRSGGSPGRTWPNV